MRARHRLSTLLLRQGIVYSGGHAWTGAHDAWLRRIGHQGLGMAATQLTFESDYETVIAVSARRDRLDEAIAVMASDSQFTPVVRRLGCRWELAPPAARARGDLGNRRLHARWDRFTARRKRPVIANVAITRELAGWCWSLAVIDE